MPDEEKLTVVCAAGAPRDLAQSIAHRTGGVLSDDAGEGLSLLVAADGVSLVGYGLSFRGDFTELSSRVTNGRLQHEMIAHVAKTKKERPRAIDATAGMGEDAFILAAAGYEVTLYERHPVIAALLKDALRRAKRDATIAPIVERMHLIEDDSVGAMTRLDSGVDLVYLDPMFPERKKSGLIGKKLQLIQKLEHPCVEEAALLDAATACATDLVVIKRPLKGPYLAGVKPDYSILGKAIRYDCIRPKHAGRT